MRRLVPISLPTLLFLLKELNQCQILERDNELQKPSHILVFDYEKGKATCIEYVWCPKAKGVFIKLKYQKFQASILKRDVKIKNYEML